MLRINCSHATHQEMAERVEWLRNANGRHGAKANLRAIMFDTKGPEIRTGELAAKLEVEQGDTVLVTSTTSPISDRSHSHKTITVDYDHVQDVPVGVNILVDDGLVELTVQEKKFGGVICNVENSGIIGSRRGVNIPGATLQLPPLTKLDREHLKIAVDMDADFIAASFVRSAECVRRIRAYIEECMEKSDWPELHPAPKIISKIESTEALKNFTEILEVSDGVMVARGDLGVEIPFSVVTRAQKMIVRQCNLAGKPVVVATQMLESMIENPRPTRAEVSDVVNAVYDGADCVMLSGESAKGKWPVLATTTLATIAGQADMSYAEFGRDHEHRNEASNTFDKLEAIAAGAVQSATAMQADLIICVSKSGRAARLLARQRGPIPIMAFVDNPKVGRQLSVHRGVFPVYQESTITEKYPDPFIVRPRQAVRRAKEMGFVKAGDTVVIVLAEPQSSVLGGTLTTRVAVVQ